MESDFDKLKINEYLKENNSAKYNTFCDFTSIMKDKLNQKQWYIPVAYIPHDFDHHVIRVLQYGSHLLSRSMDEFSTEELLAFQYACLLHDVDMIYNPLGKEMHSIKTRLDLTCNPFAELDRNNEDGEKLLNIIKSKIRDTDEIENIDKTIKESMTEKIHQYLQNAFSFHITDTNMRAAIGEIIYGHSDIKRADQKIKIDTLSAPYYTEVTVGDEKIKTRVLAAVLRLADVLDCSVQRIADIEAEYTVGTDEEIETIKLWNQLRVINTINFNMPNIKIKVDTKYIAGVTGTNTCFDMLMEVYETIKHEYANVRNVLVEENTNITINEPQLDFGMDIDMKSRFDEFYKEREAQKRNCADKQPLNIQEIRDYITSTIKDKNLICEGHHFIPGHGNIPDKGMRNYLDCNGLLADQRVLDDVSRAFVNYIYTENFEQIPREVSRDGYFLVGVANSGVVLASRVALMTGLPMMYFIPSQKEKKYTDQEKAWKQYSEYYKNRSAILITGVNVRGAAIEDAQMFLKKTLGEATIKAVLGVINRDVNEHYSVLKRLRKEHTEVAFILNEYPVDWCRYASDDSVCPYNDRCGRKEQKERTK